jgi:NADH dehydrogenase
VITRDAARAARFDGEVEIVIGDARDADSLAPALTGAEVVVSAMHGFAGPGNVSPASVDRDGNAHLIDAARAIGADVVLMSIVGATASSPMELWRMKAAAERHLEISGVRSTVISATAFLELWMDLLEGSARRSGRPIVFGRGDNPINFVSVNDVAWLVERGVIDATTRGSRIEIGGPANLTLNELARAVQTAAGRTSAPRHVPPTVLRLVAETIGRARPEIGRLTRAALAMDRLDLTFDPSAVHRAYPDLPVTHLTDVLAAR